MPRLVGLTPGDGDFASFDGNVQRVKITTGADGVQNDVSSSNPVPVAQTSRGTHYAPGFDVAEGVTADQPPSYDPAGNLVARAQILTDEGGYRCNFANSSLAVAVGTATFTNGSRTVTSSGFLAADMRVGDYIKVDAHAESAWTQIDDIVSDTEITLAANYPGATVTGACSRAIVKPVTGAGASITVASGQCTIAAGTTTNAISEIERDVDWLPLIKQAGVAVSQRIANQSTYIGYYDEGAATPRWFAWFLLDGTTDTTVKCQSARNPTVAPSVAETEETVVTLPNGRTTASNLRYRVEVLGDRVSFWIDGVNVANHFRACPGPGDLLTSTVRVINGGSAPAGNTNVVIDYDLGINHNKLACSMLSDGEQIIAVPPSVERFTYTAAGVITINTALIQVDCARHKSLSWQCVSMGTTGVVTPEWSSNGTTWVGDTFFTAAGASATTFNAAGNWVTNVRARYFRLRLSTATTAGTTTINLDACTVRQQTFLATQPVSGTVTANIGTGSLAAGTNTIGGVRLVADAGQGAGTNHRTAFVANITTGVPTLIKNAAGNLNSLRVANNSGVGVWFHLYNLAAAPTLGTSTPEVSVWVPAGSTYTHACGPFGERFATGMSYAICDNCAAVPVVGGTITIASTAAAIAVTARYT